VATKDEKDPHGSCAAGTTEYNVKGKVTGGTGLGTSVKGKIKGEVCVDANLDVTLEPDTVLKL